HGLPYPENLGTARMLEDIVRQHGAVPATIAILGGALKAGLDADELMHLARSEHIAKVSRRDLPIVVAQKGDGATTVAATMMIAAMAGIEVFATGGIGGVHRGQPFDVSADLVELAQTQVVVVCAGAKAILDLPLTLEYLETHGVPVLGYQTDTFPAFYTRSSGLSVDTRVDTAQQVADIARVKWDMGLSGGLLVTVPIPLAEAARPDVIESAIQTALQDAESEGLRGKAVTPYLLSRIVELTGGQSMQANIALLKNNAAVAASIAVALQP
ncbi:MAG: pseudouridine-5'-phosphate glycosidase, partial [Anaerolineae bacterium]|nr:pseudouridine-5'-phosphate glycosidase [Anaerolineae bacterium]